MVAGALSKTEHLPPAFTTTMKLILSDDSPLSTIITSSSGEALYHIDTLYKQGHRTTIIRRSRNAPASYSSSTKDTQSVLSEGETITNERDNEFSELASIEWHTFASSKLRYEGKEVDLKQFMPNEKSFSRGRRVITAPDGRTYRWNHPVLELNDGSKTPIAVYKRSRCRSREHATLEIMPEGEHMRDLIMITWVYVEKIIRNQRKARRVAIMAAVISGAGM